MREKLDDDDDDVYKELVYISKRCFCVALFCVFVCRRINFFFLSFSSETKLIVEFRVRQMENVRSEREKQLGNSSRILVLSKCSFTREIVRSACEQRKLYSVQHHYEYF